jgi:hypothetical protein
MTKRILFLGIFWAIAPITYAQITKIKERSLVTDKEITITIEGANKKDLQTKTRESYTTIYKRNADNLLLGNRCAEKVMKDYHFRYEIVPPNYQIKSSQYFVHNFFANFKLFFKNGPFWKSRVQKKINECRKLTKDFVGR